MKLSKPYYAIVLAVCMHFNFAGIWLTLWIMRNSLETSPLLVTFIMGR